MELHKLYTPQGPVAATKVYVGHRIQLAQLENGEWVALNYCSVDPGRLSSRDHRAMWARVQGLSAKEVENHVRREKAAKRAAAKKALIDEAASILEAAGYTVTKGK